MCSILRLTQQNYLAKMDLDGSIFFHENRVFMSVQVWIDIKTILGDTMWCHLDLDRHKDGIFMEKYRAVQGRFGEVVLLCNGTLIIPQWLSSSFWPLLLNQAHAGCGPACSWFLKINPVRIVGMRGCVCVFVFVCLRPRLLITNGVMWRDMDLI